MNDELKRFLREENNIISKLPQQTCAYLLCGSALHIEKYNDIDFMVYTTEDKQKTAKKIGDILTSANREYSTHLISELSMVSLKYQINGTVISLHIVEMNALENYVDEISTVSTFSKMDVFSFDLKISTVCRKWITETEFVSGNKEIADALKARLQYDSIPYQDIREDLRASIQSKINYYYEIKKKHSIIEENIIGIQVLNDAILFCYAENRTLFGTVKYVETDLRSFGVNTDLCNICLDLLTNIPGNLEKAIKSIEELITC